MPTGVCKLWNLSRGFGFVRTDEPGPDVFVHAYCVRNAGYSALAVGQKVRCELGISPKTNREQAVKVELIEPIISPKVEPRAFHVDEESPRDIAEAAFMRR